MVEKLNLEKLKEGVVVVKMFAEWCMPCKQFAPVFEKTAGSYKDKAVFLEANIEEFKDFSTEYEIRSIPTILFFKDGEYYMMRTGAYTQEQLEAFIDMVIKGE